MQMKHLLFALTCLVGAAQAAPIVNNATIRLPLPGKTVSAGYLSIENPDNHPLVLRSASSPMFGLIELHHHIEVDGMLRMVKIETLEIAPRSTVHLQPGSYHLMMFRPTKPLTKDSKVELVLTWADGSKTYLTPTITSIPKS